MQTINLTNEDGRRIRVNPDHIVAYGPSSDGSDVILSVHEDTRCIRVKETAEEIDKLLLELP